MPDFSAAGADAGVARIPPYLEIEADDETQVWTAAAALGGASSRPAPRGDKMHDLSDVPVEVKP